MKRQYTPGLHKVKCDICSKTRRNNEMRYQWNGLLVCADTCWSPKHPNEYPRPTINDGLPVPDARPRLAVENMPVITQAYGTTLWEDPTLIWESNTWIWSDNPADVSAQSLLMQDPSLDL